LKNTKAYLAKNPGSADAYYTLARIHYVAFILKTETVPGYGAQPGELPGVEIDIFDDSRFTEARQKHAEELARAELGIGSGVPKKQEERHRYVASVARHREELENEHWHPDMTPPTQLIEHAEQAVTAFHKAIELDRKNALYSLGLGSLLEQ